MSLFNHLRGKKHDKSGSSSRSNSVEPSRDVPRIITTTDAPSIVNRDLLKPKMSRPKVQDRSVSEASGFSAASDATVVPDENRNRNNRSSILDRAKAAVMNRSGSPSPSTSPESTSRKQLGPRGNHIVTDAVASFRPKMEAELKGYKEAELAAGVSSESLFGFIANERLRRMPARGSRWDKILKWAEDFAKKLSLFEVTDDRFIPSSKEAVELILASIQLLLMVGPTSSSPPSPACCGFTRRWLHIGMQRRCKSTWLTGSSPRLARTPERRGPRAGLWHLPRIWPHLRFLQA